MKYFSGVLVLILIASGVWYLTKTGSGDGETEPEVKSQSSALSKVRQGEAVLMDVRTPEEWAAGHEKDAILFDSRRIDRGELPEVAKDKPVYLYCRSGNRAGVVKTILEQKGFTNVTNLGGLADMEALGAEMVR